MFDIWRLEQVGRWSGTRQRYPGTLLHRPRGTTHRVQPRDKVNVLRTREKFTFMRTFSAHPRVGPPSSKCTLGQRPPLPSILSPPSQPYKCPIEHLRTRSGVSGLEHVLAPFVSYFQWAISTGGCECESAPSSQSAYHTFHSSHLPPLPPMFVFDFDLDKFFVFVYML
ncbi:unnamed protein product [Cyclocybe aegerita]|uniref:Uncharacterized protein n=1 Tax=Cyclocybe aegerita TaxID=1973307 RepID=A0A8S0X880_CYCAE|nr:unnamed protein product [Cyclocybe aegerita]